MSSSHVTSALVVLAQDAVEAAQFLLDFRGEAHGTLGGVAAHRRGGLCAARGQEGAFPRCLGRLGLLRDLGVKGAPSGLRGSLDADLGRVARLLVTIPPLAGGPRGVRDGRRCLLGATHEAPEGAARGGGGGNGGGRVSGICACHTSRSCRMVQV
ncbi:hypothetical protein F751_5741 [Auxenochlorella protothecoides]|uniref:Uncharacterized protein n=1 Tax=Auxenochlorella protothecoides TaxID=3075 RepID=A0A087SU99_AUXPR|nr:hypothetical protein F751_5741 [Auxenochlorella protothecoides]KFM29303.1 hypothetical protein F751_5741 [Auxenochlorella protothecoides]